MAGEIMSEDGSRRVETLNVLHVIPSVSNVHGGPSSAIVAMERALTAAGIEVTTATTDDDGRGRRLSLSARPAEVNGAKRIYSGKWLEFYKVAPGLVLWLWRNVRNFDVVHIHAMFSFTSIAAGMVARTRRVPYIIRPLGTLARYGVTQRRPWLKQLSLRLVEGPLLKAAASVHFTSQSEMDEARTLNIPFRGTVIPLGVETSVIAQQGTTSALDGREKSRLTVLYLSRIDPKKNIEGLLDAFALVAHKRRDVMLRIAGGGPGDYVGALKARVSTLRLEGRVDWMGHIEGDEKAAALATADLFVLPSFSENFGIAAVEAMLAGLPCILSEGVGIAGEVQAADAGLVVAPEADAIARALGELIDDGDKRRRAGQQARELALRQYSTAAMARRLAELYASLAPVRLEQQS